MKLQEEEPISFLREDQTKRRSSIEIAHDILNNCQRKKRLTHIQYQANLSSASCNEYVSHLISAGLLQEEIREEAHYYIVTPLGLEYVLAFRKLAEMIS